MMKQKYPRYLILLLIFLATPITSFSHEYSFGLISIVKPHLRETPPSATVAAGYLKIKNNGNEPETLLGASSTLSKTIQIHEMKIENEIMKMREVPEGLVINPGQVLELKAGGYHLMFFDLVRQVKEGQIHEIKLNFKNSGEILVPFKVWEGLHKPQGHSEDMNHHNH